MNFPFYIARRYLFSKKSHHAINIISAISVGGVAFSTMALVCTLSVFNGFFDLIGGLYTHFDPELEIRPTTGKFAEANDSLLLKVRQHPQVAVVSESLEEQALILFVNRPLIIHLKGVDENFNRCTNIDSILYVGEDLQGQYMLEAAGLSYGIPSIGLTSQFGKVNYGALPICAPRRGERINVANPSESFKVDYLYSPGVFFQVHQKLYDENYMLTSIDFARQLFEQPGKISSLLLRLKEGAHLQQVKEELSSICGSRFTVKDRYEQHQETFNIMKIEKTMAYLFLTLMLLIACFNIIGSMAMLIIDKRADIATLRHLGANETTISRIFLFESRLITLLGCTIGIVLGLLLCWLQDSFGWLRLGGSSGNFIIDAYPVSVHFSDIALVFFTVLLVGFVTAWYPVRQLCRRML